VAIDARRGGWEVRVYAGVDPVTGKPHRISRQVQGSRRKAEKEETRLKAQVMEGRHRGTRAKTFAEMVGLYLDWREHNGKPIGPRTIRGYWAPPEPMIKPGSGSCGRPRSTRRRWTASTRPCARTEASASWGSRCPRAGFATCTRSSPARSRWRPGTAGSLQRGNPGQAAGAAERQAANAHQGAGTSGAPGRRAEGP
jgi:hypothetical protein